MTLVGSAGCQVSESRSGASGNNVARDMCMQFGRMIQARAMATEINRGKDTGKAAAAPF